MSAFPGERRGEVVEPVRLDDVGAGQERGQGLAQRAAEQRMIVRNDDADDASFHRTSPLLFLSPQLVGAGFSSIRGNR